LPTQRIGNGLGQEGVTADGVETNARFFLTAFQGFCVPAAFAAPFFYELSGHPPGFILRKNLETA
jgi:hypothetical protein